MQTALAYIQAMPGTTTSNLRGHESQLKDWARRSGFNLEEIFIDRNYQANPEFDRMMTIIANRAHDSRPDVVVLPHPYALGATNDDRVRREEMLGRYGITPIVALTLSER
jgi:hypothetical protein